MNKWNELCYIAHTHQRKNSKEEIFQVEIENFFEKLGWARSKGEIVAQYPVQMGSTTKKADIAIVSAEKLQLIVELKQPNVSVEKHKEQLISYMRVLKLRFGVLIGDKFQLYYDDFEQEGTEAQKVFEADFLENNTQASELLLLLTKEQFGKEKLLSFSEKQLEKIQESDTLNELQLYVQEQAFLFKKNLYEELQESYDSELIREVFEHLNISSTPIVAEKVSLEQIENTTFDKLPIEFVPKDLKLFKQLLLEKKKAYVDWYYQNGRVEAQKPWDASRFSKDSNLLANVRSRPEARKGKWKELGLTKVVYKIEK